MFRKKTIRKGFVSIGAVLILMLATPFLGSAIIGFETAGQTYQSIEEIPAKDIALVLGAAAYPSRLSDVLKDRVDTAIELYKAKKVGTLLMSGSETEVKAMEKYALENGVSEEAIKKDPNGLNTMASVQNAAKLNKSLTIVTQEFHLPRALFIANTLGLDAVGMVADKHTYIKIDEFEAREILATSKAILDTFVLN